MLEITRLKVENKMDGVVTDEANPRFTFALESDRQDVTLVKAEFSVSKTSGSENKISGSVSKTNGAENDKTNGAENDKTSGAVWARETDENFVVYNGEKLTPFTEYVVSVNVTDNYGSAATAQTSFETGRLDEAWQAKWITDEKYIFTEKGVSPRPMYFKKQINIDKRIKSAKIYSTALGIYELELNGKKVGGDYFAPGFTSYKSQLQYQVYDITEMLSVANSESPNIGANGGKPQIKSNELVAVVSGGWAVGSFVFTRKNRVYADRQALLLEIRITYEDGLTEVISTDSTWQVTTDGKITMADIYDGETFDASLDMSKADWHNASVESLRISPQITATYGALTKEQEIFKPINCTKINDELIYDFGQNLAGVVRIKLNGKLGQTIIIKHAEILNPDGSLNTAFLRSAKATATYICAGGTEEYSPRHTYMGFRYASVSGVDKSDIIEISAIALYSDIETTGSFECSNAMLNRLQSNIVWSAKSNFVDIPTDCPQRDERMGWTGDLAAFAPTACYNFDMSRFTLKWLKDMCAEQLKSGGIPNTIPSHGYGFPATMPTMAVDFWGDAVINVPYAEYLARGDIELVRKMYPAMKKYVKACKFWAGLFSFGKKRYIWNTPGILHFGDWVAPDLPKMQQWQARRNYTATASLYYTSGMVAKIADLLGESEDAKYYNSLSGKVKDAFISVLTDGNGKTNEEFQTAYVLPLRFGIFEGDGKKRAAANLARLVREGNYRVGTGFPGTPHVLFALADNGYADEAFKMLLCTDCPSWLYEVKVGATTVWERWDGLDENGECPIGDSGTADVMISYNHYAHGSVGNFLYERVLGVTATSAGYKEFKIAPLLGGNLDMAKGSVLTPYGEITSEWTLVGNKFTLKVTVPVSTRCEVQLPDGTLKSLGSGSYELKATV